MSEWQSPQDYPHRETNGIDRLVGAVRTVGEKARESTANLLRTAGIFITQSGMRIASSLTVEGDLTSTGSADITGTTHIGGATDIDGTLNVDADATFGGAVAITGTLSLPAGIIDNEALASPVTYGSDKAFALGPATTTTRANVATANILVPEGFSKAQVFAFSDAMALNSTATADYLYVATAIGTYDGGENYISCASGFATHVSHTAATALTGLVGGTFIACNVSTRTNTGAWAASGANLWRIQAVAIFTR